MAASLPDCAKAAPFGETCGSSIMNYTSRGPGVVPPAAVDSTTVSTVTLKVNTGEEPGAMIVSGGSDSVTLKCLLKMISSHRTYSPVKLGPGMRVIL